MADGSADRSAANDSTATATVTATASPSPTSTTPPTKASLIKRVEFLFSRDNLTADVTLQYQMNYECYVPIVAVINHPKIKELTSDAELITEAIKSTSIVSLDDTKTYVKPAYKIPRVTIILREIPSTTPSEEIEKIFEGEESAKPIKVKSEVGDNWYVTFANEDDMMKAFLYSRTRKFNGESVKARIKSEILAKSFYYPLIADPHATAQYGGYNQGQYYYSQSGGQHSGEGRGRGSNAHSNGGQRYNNNVRRPIKKGEYRKPNPNYNAASSNAESQPNNGEGLPHHPPRNPGQRPHYSKDHSYASRENIPVNENSKENSHQRGAQKDSTTPQAIASVDPSNKNKRTTATRRRTGSETKQPGNHGGAFQLGTSHFPPLPSKDNGHSHGAAATSGYSKDFKKHNQTTIIDAIKALPETATIKPAALPTIEECPAILQKPRTILEIASSRIPSANETSEQIESHNNNIKIDSTPSPSSLAVSPSPSPSSPSPSSASSSSSTTIATTTVSSPSAVSPSTSSSSLWSQIVGTKTEAKH